MTPKLIALRDERADYWRTHKGQGSDLYSAGFDAACAELLPVLRECVKTLNRIQSATFYTDEIENIRPIASETLAKLNEVIK
jgi:hypothetical protein